VSSFQTPWTVVAGSGSLPGVRVLSRSNPSTPSAMNRACQVHTTCLTRPPPHGFGGTAAVSGGEDDLGDVLLRRTAIRDDRLKPTAISRLTLTTIPALMPRA
jgi:hypothetical protein